MSIGRLGRIASNLSHDNIKTHGGRVDGLTYTNAQMYGLPDTQLSLKDEGPGLSTYYNMYHSWTGLYTRKISSNTFMTGQTGVNNRNDYTGPVDVEEKFFNLYGSPGAGDYRIYIARANVSSCGNDSLSNQRSNIPLLVQRCLESKPRVAPHKLFFVQDDLGVVPLNTNLNFAVYHSELNKLCCNALYRTEKVPQRLVQLPQRRVNSRPRVHVNAMVCVCARAA